jgi:hypothetical protein
VDTEGAAIIRRSAQIHVSRNIFVSIAAYRDDELWPTVLDAIAQASHPQALRVVVLEQSAEPTHASLQGRADLQRLGGLHYMHLHHQYSRGPCWARSLLGTLLQEEDYFLQIDSHMRFDARWDEHLIETLESLKAQNTRSILSTYPCRFEYSQATPAAPGEQDRRIRKHPNPGQALVLRPKPQQVLGEQHPVLTFQSVPTQTSTPVPGHHVGAGCLFSRADLLREVPIDPHLYFHGEEQNIATRAWTSGWDIWHMPDMPIYHLYQEPGRSSRPLHWDAQEDLHRTQPWHALEQRSRYRMADLLYGHASPSALGCFGLGRERTLEEFARASGIDYPGKKIDYARDIGSRGGSSKSSIDFSRMSWYRNSVFRSVVLKEPSTR